MATKINAADVNVMTFNADPFVASDEYGEEELQEILNKAYITELSGDDAEQARVMLEALIPGQNKPALPLHMTPPPSRPLAGGGAVGARLTARARRPPRTTRAS